MRRIRNLLHLPLGDKLLLVRMALLLLLIRLALSGLSFQTTRRVLARAADVGSSVQTRNGSDRERKRIIWAATQMSRYVARERPCLPQALAVQFSLRRRGYPTVLRIGVAKGTDEQLQAHAWLECEGDVLIGGSLSPQFFTALPPLLEEQP